MPYVGRDLQRGNYLKLDDISSSFDGSTTTFNLTSGGNAFFPGSAFSIIVSLGGVIQEPESAFQIDKSQIIFAAPPSPNDDFFCIVQGVALGVGVPGHNTVNNDQLAKPLSYGDYFRWDSANNRVGINTLLPSTALDVVGNATFSGNVSIGGTLTYEDVANIDAVGIITARAGIEDKTLTAGRVVYTGTGGRLVDNSGLTFNPTTLGVPGLSVAGVTTFTQKINLSDNFIRNCRGFNTGNEQARIVVKAGDNSAGGGLRIVEYYNDDTTLFSSEIANFYTTGIELKENVSVTGDLTIPDSIIHSGDTNTKIRFPANDEISLETSGHDRIYIKSDGKVGIGTDTPVKHLHLNSNGLNGVSFRMENYEGYSTFHNDGGALHFDSGFHLFRNEDGSSEFLRIASSGKVGINQSSPYADVDITSSVENTDTDALSAHGIRLAHVGAADEEVIPITAGFRTQQDRARAGIGFISKTISGTDGLGGAIGFYTRNSPDGTPLKRTDERVRIAEDGKFGIGTDNPGSLFQVGTDTSGKLTFDGANTLAITGPEGGAARIDLIADQGDDAGDKWRITNTSGNLFKIQRTTSHTDALSIDTVGNITAVNTTSGGTTGVTLKVGANASSGTNSGTIIINNGGQGNASLQFDYEGSAARAKIYTYKSTNDIIFDTSGTEVFRIIDGGNIRQQKANANPNFTLSRNASIGNDNQVIGTIDFASNTAHTVQARLMGKNHGTNNVGGYLVVETRVENGSLTEKLRVNGDGQSLLTRGTVGGQESIGNVNNTWWKIGTWAGPGVDAAARATITVLGANTHNANNPAGGETKIYLSITGTAAYASFYSHTDYQQGVIGVAHKYDPSASSCEIWVKYSSGYSSTSCFADVTNGFFTGASVNTGSSSTPSGATLATAKYVVRTSDGTTSSERFKIGSNGGTIMANAGTVPASTNETLFLQGEGHNGHGTSNTRSVISITGAATSNTNSMGIWIGARTNENTAVIGTRTSSGNLAVETYNSGWAERFRIRSDGKVVLSNSTGAMLDLRTAAGTGNCWVQLSDSAGNQKGYFGFGSSSNETLYIVQQESADIAVYTGSSIKWKFTTGGSFEPGANDSYDIGSSGNVVRNIYTGDLHLNNTSKEKGNDVDGTNGSWTIQEGQDDLYIINKLNGKKYRIPLEEVN